MSQWKLWGDPTTGRALGVNVRDFALAFAAFQISIDLGGVVALALDDFTGFDLYWLIALVAASLLIAKIYSRLQIVPALREFLISIGSYCVLMFGLLPELEDTQLSAFLLFRPIIVAISLFIFWYSMGVRSTDNVMRSATTVSASSDRNVRDAESSGHDQSPLTD